MTRNLKTLGLSLMAVFAMSAVAASAASAEMFVFTSAAEETTLSGSQVGATQITVDAGSASCETAKFSGTMTSDTVLEMSLIPTYSGCKFAGFTGTTIDMNSCEFVFGAVETEGSSYGVENRIDCAKSTESIAITARIAGVLKCTIHIGEQEGLKKISVSNEGSPKKLRASIGLTGIKYSQTEGVGAGKCANAENTTNGTYEGEEAIEGKNKGGTQVNLEALQIPQKIKIKSNPIKFTGAKETFEVENLVNEAITIKFWIHPGVLNPMQKCVKLAKKNDTCTEEIECTAAVATGLKLDLGVITQPLGGDAAKVEGC
jgi:hypothetical protein